MWELTGTLLISALGGAIFLHYLKNFLLKEKARFQLDWDGVVERVLITYTLVAATRFLLLIPVIITGKILFRLLAIRFIPATSYQKVLLKGELAFDLILSPAFAFLVGVLFK